MIVACNVVTQVNTKAFCRFVGHKCIKTVSRTVKHLRRIGQRQGIFIDIKTIVVIISMKISITAVKRKALIY